MGRVDQRIVGFYESVEDALCEFAFYCGKNRTSHRDKNGDVWSIEERVTKGGGVITPPEFPYGFDYLVVLFFKLRSFIDGYGSPITPGLINDLGEYISSVDRDMIYNMDIKYRNGAFEASEYWKDK